MDGCFADKMNDPLFLDKSMRQNMIVRVNKYFIDKIKPRARKVPVPMIVLFDFSIIAAEFNHKIGTPLHYRSIDDYVEKLNLL